MVYILTVFFSYVYFSELMNTSTQFTQIPIGQIQEDLHQPRKNFGTEGDKNRLLLSLKEIGLQAPITVKKSGPDTYLIVDGHRRYKCALEIGWKTISCRVLDELTAAQIEKVRFEVQNNRRPWKPLERADALARIKELAGFGTNKELAGHLYLSETLVSNSLQLRGQKEDYKKLMDTYDLSESYRVEFVKLLPKLRQIREWDVPEIIETLFQRVQHRVIQTSKDFRTIGRIFLRATANEDMILLFLKDPDMTVGELERHTIQSGFALWIEQVIQKTTTMSQLGTAFSAKELVYLKELRDLLNKVL